MGRKEKKSIMDRLTYRVWFTFIFYGIESLK